MSKQEDVLLHLQWLLFIAETLSQYWEEHYFSVLLLLVKQLNLNKITGQNQSILCNNFMSI